MNLMRGFYPGLFHHEVHSCRTFKIKWAKISYELNKSAASSQDFKKDSQCRERWLNHLSPHLNKYSFLLTNNSLKLIFSRKGWSMDDDILLMEKASQLPKKWAKIALAFLGRNQHSIKNRFIYLINKEFDLKWNETKDFMKRQDLQSLTKQALDSLISQRNLTKSQCKSENQSIALSAKDNSVIYPNSPWDGSEERGAWFMDFSSLY